MKLPRRRCEDLLLPLPSEEARPPKAPDQRHSDRLIRKRHPIRLHWRNPEVGEAWTLRICTAESVKAVWVQAKSLEKSWILELTRDGYAKSIDIGPYGLTAKENCDDSHLEDAALRSGDYPDQISWSISMPTLGESEVLEYFFDTDSGETSGVFVFSSSSWMSRLDRILSIRGVLELSRRVTEPKWLVDSTGATSKVKFSIKLEDYEHVVGFGERFHGLDQRNELVDAVVFEEYKGQGHRTYLPSPFAIVVGGKFGFHIKTSAPSRYDVGRSIGDEIQIEVELLPGQRELAIDLFEGDPAQVLNQYMNSVGKPKLPPDWIYTLWMSSNEWNTQQRVESEIDELACRLQAEVHLAEQIADGSLAHFMALCLEFERQAVGCSCRSSAMATSGRRARRARPGRPGR